MGAWGSAAFENDDALDRLDQLLEGDGLTLVVEAFHDVQAETGYLEAPQSSCALAAAEIVAALKGKPPVAMPEEATAWIAALGQTPDEAMIRAAIAAVDRVAADSELRELWEESDYWSEWQGQIEDLRRRLQDTP